MTRTITIDPITRIEGHLAIHVDVADGVVTSGHCAGEMFRGFENILRGRDPLDAHQLTQRICGVCPVSHGTAAILGQDMAFGVTPTTNGRLLRNLILGANFLQSHIVHFYQLTALDYIDIAAILGYGGSDSLLLSLKSWAQTQSASKVIYPLAPFLPRYEGRYVEDKEVNLLAIHHYFEALEMRKTAHQMCALFAGKMPHPATLMPGGVSEQASVTKMEKYGSLLRRLQRFISEAYLPDVELIGGAFPEYFKIGKGCNQFLSYGNFPDSDESKQRFLPAGVLIGKELSGVDEAAITESVASSLLAGSKPLKPSEGETIAAPEKEGKGVYSWLKAPRYHDQPMEVGPLARMLIAYRLGSPGQARDLIDASLARLGRPLEDLVSTMGRHLARAIEAKLVADQLAVWLDQLKPGLPSMNDFEIPEQGRGYGMIEAPRGALGHWIEIKDHKISNYQCIVPTTWNCSPRDERGVAGPVEQALVGTPLANPDQPLEAARVVRSFDPCLACAVH